MTRLNDLEKIKKLTPQKDKGGIAALKLVKGYNDSYSKNTEGGITALSLSESPLESLELTDADKALEYLYLSGNPSLKKVTLVSLPKLTHLYLDNCALEEITIPAGCNELKQIYLQKNQLKKIVFEGDCPELELLDLSGNQLCEIDLPKGFDELKYLYLNDNKIEKIGIACTPQLNILNLQNNQFSSIPISFLTSTSNDIQFTLSGNLVLKLETLKLSGNPLPSDIRGFVEDKNNCLSDIREYYQDLAKGYALDNEYKTLIIGNGNVGKSCLVHRLIDNTFKDKWDSTHGIALEQYKTNDYIFNLWDFGGQDIYHATHRLFMKCDALYLVLWDVKTEESPFTEHKIGDECRAYDNYRLGYWLDYTKNQGENSPVIVVQTKTKRDGAIDLSDIRAQYQNQFPVLQFQHIDSSENNWDKNGFNKLLSDMRLAVEDFNRQKETPANRANLRQILRDKQKRGEKQLSMADYLALAEGVQNPMSVLENWLVKTGVVFYREGLFQNNIILDQAWAIDAIYTIFRRTTDKGRRNRTYYDIQSQNGHFTGADLQEIWEEKYLEEEQKLFISFMLSCEMCFETTKQEHPDLKDWEINGFPLQKRSFVAPQLMPEKKPVIVEDIWSNRPSWYLTYTHNFLHYGIIQSFIVRTQFLAEMREIWKSGISLKEGDHLALVECEGKTIKVRVTEGGKELLNKIRNLLEKLQDSKGLEAVSIDGTHYVSLEKLKNYPKDNPKIQTETDEWVETTKLAIFLERDEKIDFIKPENEKDMTQQDAQAQVQTLIGNAKIDKAIELIENWAKHNDAKELGKSIAVIKSNYLKLRKDETLGLERYVNYTPITYGILNLDWATEISTPTPPIVQVQPPIPPSSSSNDTKVKILFFGANPFNTGKLNLKGEYAEIAKRLEDDKIKEKLKLNSEFSTTLEDFQVKSAGYKPNIIHFAGHGKDADNEMSEFARGIGLADWKNDAGLVFFDREHTKPIYINGDTLDYNLEILIDDDKVPIEIVIFNACFSVNQAEVIAKRIKYVIGVNNKILDDASIDFTAGFYRVLAETNDVKSAFRRGKGLALPKLENRNQIVLYIDGEKTTL